MLGSNPAGITTTSEEACAIPFPRFAQEPRKLHIRSLLLPFQTGPTSLGSADSITLTGGCAKNDGLKAAIEQVLKLKVVELTVDPQLMGALGAAEYARQKGLAS